MTTYVFDACAVIAYLNQEHGSDVVKRLLLQADCERLMAMVNVYEICYDAARQKGIDQAMHVYQQKIQPLPVQLVHTIDEAMLRQAIYFKTTYAVSVADALALGLAKSKQAILVTADHHECDVIDQAHDLSFCWIR